MEIIERPIYQDLREALSDQRIVVITGMRRVGKTTSVRWLLDQLPTENKIFLDLERLDQRAVFQESNYDLVLNFLQNRGMDLSRPLTVALDEIQYAPNLPSVVKYLYDHYGIKFLLTGSSSFYLKNYFSESMAGRKIVFELFSLGFGEFLDFRGIPYRRQEKITELRFDVYEYNRLKSYYDEFVTFGGLPDVVLEQRPNVKREILQDVLTSYINLDVQTLADFRKIGQLQQLMQLLVLRVGNKIDLSKLAVLVGISRPTLAEYLDFLEKTYVIHRLPAFTGPDKTTALGRKLYFRDNGIASVLAQPGEGALFENAVFNQLWHYGSLAYLSSRNEYEIDYVLTPEENLPIGLEAKYHPTLMDAKRLNQMSKKTSLSKVRLVGKHPSPGFEDFIWGGSIF